MSIIISILWHFQHESMKIHCTIFQFLSMITDLAASSSSSSACWPSSLAADALAPPPAPPTSLPPASPPALLPESDSTPLQSSSHFIGSSGAREVNKLNKISPKSSHSLASVSASNFDKTVCSRPLLLALFRVMVQIVFGSLCANCRRQLAAALLSSK